LSLVKYSPLLLVFVFQNSYAQTKAVINTDRPDQSDGIYILPQKSLQLEDGLLFYRNNFENNLMLRYGLIKGTEARILFDYCLTDQSNGLLPVGLSVKKQLVIQHKYIPAITFVGYIRFGPIASNHFKLNSYPTNLKLAFQNDINENISISYNVGTSEKFDNVNCTFNIGFSSGKKLSSFVEYFSFFDKLSPSLHNIDGGLLYLLSNNFQIDVALGSSIVGEANSIYITSGISYRFK